MIINSHAIPLWKNVEKFLTSEKLQQTSFLILTSVLILSIINVFSHHLPIRPSTSLGISLSLISLLTIVVIIHTLKDKRPFPSQHRSMLDVLVVLYICVNAISLVTSPVIDTTLNFEIVVYSGILFFVAKLIVLSQQQKRLLLIALGIWGALIASLSVLQVLLPSFMNQIALKFFSGDDSYGLVSDFLRGRLLHWGAIILVFPAFYASILYLLKMTKDYFMRRRIVALWVIGTGTFILSMVTSNFRWTFATFLLVSALFVKYLYVNKLISLRFIWINTLILASLVVIGMVLAEVRFGYSLIDRLLLSNSSRDVNETLGRFYLFNQGFTLFMASPILGVGPGNYLGLVDPHELIRYLTIYDQSEVNLAPIASHNDLILILAETGIVGFLLAVLIFYVTLKKLYLLTEYYQDRDETEFIFYLTFFCSFAAFLLYGLFENIFPHNYLFIFFIAGYADISYGRLLKNQPTSA